MEFQKNSIVTVTIEDMGSEGEGIGKVDGFTLFVKDAVMGDTVEARIVKNKKNYAYARLEKVVVPSPFRVKPECAYHRQCGGCQLQALSYEKQLGFKQEKIRNSLIRIGGFAPEYVDGRMEPIIGMGAAGGKIAAKPGDGEALPGPFRYRNKAQYPIGTDKNGNVVAGFYAGRTHTIIANTNCLLGAEENEAVLNCVLDYMRENHVSAYDETSGTGLVRHVLIRKGFTSGEIMVCLVINDKGKKRGSGESGRLKKTGNGKALAGSEGSEGSGRQTHINIEEQPGKQENTDAIRQFLPAQENLLSRLRKIQGMTSVSVSINTQQTNVIMGQEIHTIWGKDGISDTIHMRDMGQPGYPRVGEGLVFRISPLSFYQVNPAQTEKLYSLALEYAGLTGEETVWDLYCGIGTISLFLAGHAKKVCGVEVVPQAIQDARENAGRNGITNAEFFVGKAEDVLQELYGEERVPVGTGSVSGGDEDCTADRRFEMPRPDVIVVDPPRKGCDAGCLEAMLRMQPERIVYVSCDPATLARDLRVLCDGGYELKRVRGVDQFGMTVHVETVVLIQRKDT